jgi:hypothetical protein
MDQTLLTGLCAAAGGNMPNENWNRATQMQEFITKTLMEARKFLEQFHVNLMQGNMSHETGDLLGLYMNRSAVASAIGRLDRGIYAFEW